MAKKPFKCSKCDRSFSMPAHLARHMSSTHASPKKKAAAKKRRAARKRATARKTRVPKKVKARRAKITRRRKGATSKMGLGTMPVEALSRLIADARAELRRRMADLKKVIK